MMREIVTKMTIRPIAHGTTILGMVFVLFSCSNLVATPPSAEITVSVPDFAPAAGTYSSDKDVSISTVTAEASIYYTTDGSTPTKDSTPYVSSIPVYGDGRTVTINAIAIKTGMSPSAVVQAKYMIRYPTGSPQIIADHRIVDSYASIPARYIALVKQMWLSVAGESHSQAYRDGLSLLQNQDSRFAVSVAESGTPEAATSAHLRASRATWGDVGSEYGWTYGYGEEDWYTSATAIARTKASLDYCAKTGPRLSAFGFGWCWDMSWTNEPGGGEDPVYFVHWAGSSAGGPDGNARWGLDAGDQALTGNRVCMDTYLDATQQYIDYCASQGYDTKVFFTTGPVDGADGENGYQLYLKQEYIRNYVKADQSRILFDYADILCFDPDGTQNLLSFTDTKGTTHRYPVITSANYGTGSIGHIGSTGALRLGKAMWWMLARMAGWDGVSTE
jgi:hypothetical protein